MAARGHIALSLLFMLLLSLSGLALLSHSGLHLRIIAARKNKRLAAAALEQALVLSLHRYREALAAADMNTYAKPESDFFNRGTFPDRLEEGCACRHRFSWVLLRDGDGFRVVRILDVVRADRGGGLSVSGRAGVDLFQGSVPVGEPGVLVTAAGAAAPSEYLAGRGVECPASQLPLVGNFAVNRETGLLLSAALGLPGPSPDWRRIREKFGLEISAAPIPAGIYLARDGEDIAAIFVQGDLQALEFSARAGRQYAAFRQDGRRSELSYTPKIGDAAWSGAGAPAGGAKFGEKIIVHGSVWDVRQEGSAAFAPGARIELLAAGRLVVRTGLAGDQLAAGEERFPALLLMTCDRDFISGEAVDADVVIDAGEACTLQAQVLSAGALVNRGGDVGITGCLAAGDIQNAGRLRVDAATAAFAFDDFARLADCKFLKNFRVHFIQEGNDE